MKRPYILLDAGGTLVFPDLFWLSNLMKGYGIDAKEEDILKRVYEIDYLIDKSMKERVTLIEGNLLEALFGAFTKSKETVRILIEKTNERDKIKNLWAYTFDWVIETLKILKNMGYSMSVISNSDGRVEQVLKETGIAPFMDKIYDSQIVGIEKPDPAIFKRALSELSISADEAIFFGDMFYTDILGANRAGIRAVHIDPFGFYREWPGERIKNVSFIPDLVKMDLSSHRFFPFIYELSHELNG
ncbi:HAD family hydrolase [Athalassotoga saccharophila]|uniref:HAD family hydrolase n=1 Tax=Athalassotoga saccharophila TaxID=1441386 RepID=UPI001379C7DF|nr:HAD family hydrolase [Athalassotoga saccharophila]BBJ27177.1 haloacid dehalogenase-like hydrolase [Athalassotoga saccharophila]